MSYVPALGIDFGITFSQAAILKGNGSPETIREKNGENQVRSAVFYHPDSPKISVGSSDLSETSNKPDNYVTDIKNLLGRMFDDDFVQFLIKSKKYPYKIAKARNGKAEIELLHNGQIVRKTPEEITSEIFKYVKNLAREQVKIEITDVVISVPDCDSIAQRVGTKTAAEMAGFRVLELVAYSDAFAWWWNLTGDNLIVNLNASALTVTIVNKDQKNLQKIKAVKRCPLLGQIYINNELIDYFRPVLVERLGKSVDNPAILREIESVCERLKIRISDEDFIVSESLRCADGKNSEVALVLTKKDFEKIITSFLSKVMEFIDKCIKESGTNKTSINEVKILIRRIKSNRDSRPNEKREKYEWDNSMYVRRIREIFSCHFQAVEIIDSPSFIAYGAAYRAVCLKPRDLDNPGRKEIFKFTREMYPITPTSIGVTYGKQGPYFTVIHKNTQLPSTTNSYTFFTRTNDQTECIFHVDEIFEENAKSSHLCSFTVKNLPPGNATNVAFEVSISLDVSCLLKVEARELTTTRKKKLPVEFSDFGLTSSYEAPVSTIKIDTVGYPKLVTLCNYLSKIKSVREQVLANLDKVPDEDDRLFIKKKCETLMTTIKNSDYQDVEKLNTLFQKFKNLISELLKGVIDTTFLEEVIVQDAKSPH